MDPTAVGNSSELLTESTADARNCKSKVVDEFVSAHEEVWGPSNTEESRRSLDSNRSEMMRSEAFKTLSVDNEKLLEHHNKCHDAMTVNQPTFVPHDTSNVNTPTSFIHVNREIHNNLETANVTNPTNCRFGEDIHSSNCSTPTNKTGPIKKGTTGSCSRKSLHKISAAEVIKQSTPKRESLTQNQITKLREHFENYCQMRPSEGAAVKKDVPPLLESPALVKAVRAKSSSSKSKVKEIIDTLNNSQSFRHAAQNNEYLPNSTSSVPKPRKKSPTFRTGGGLPSPKYSPLQRRRNTRRNNSPSTCLIPEEKFAKLSVKDKALLFTEFIDNISQKNRKLGDNFDSLLLEPSLSEKMASSGVVNEKHESVKHLAEELKSKYPYPKQFISPKGVLRLMKTFDDITLKRKQMSNARFQASRNVSNEDIFRAESVLIIEDDDDEQVKNPQVMIKPSPDAKSKSLPNFAERRKVMSRQKRNERLLNHLSYNKLNTDPKNQSQTVFSQISRNISMSSVDQSIDPIYLSPITLAQKRKNTFMDSVNIDKLAPPKKIHRMRYQRSNPQRFFRYVDVEKLFFRLAKERFGIGNELKRLSIINTTSKDQSEISNSSEVTQKSTVERWLEEAIVKLENSVISNGEQMNVTNQKWKNDINELNNKRKSLPPIPSRQYNSLDFAPALINTSRSNVSDSCLEGAVFKFGNMQITANNAEPPMEKPSRKLIVRQPQIPLTMTPNGPICHCITKPLFTEVAVLAENTHANEENLVTSELKNEYEECRQLLPLANVPRRKLKRQAPKPPVSNTTPSPTCDSGFSTLEYKKSPMLHKRLPFNSTDVKSESSVSTWSKSYAEERRVRTLPAEIEVIKPPKPPRRGKRSTLYFNKLVIASNLTDFSTTATIDSESDFKTNKKYPNTPVTSHFKKSGKHIKDIYYKASEAVRKLTTPRRSKSVSSSTENTDTGTKTLTKGFETNSVESPTFFKSQPQISRPYEVLPKPPTRSNFLTPLRNSLQKPGANSKFMQLTFLSPKKKKSQKLKRKLEIQRNSTPHMEVIHESHVLDAKRLTKSAPPDRFSTGEHSFFGNAPTLSMSRIELESEYHSLYWITVDNITVKIKVDYCPPSTIAIYHNFFNRNMYDYRDIQFGIDNDWFSFYEQTIVRPVIQNNLREKSTYWFSTGDISVQFTGKFMTHYQVRRLFNFFRKYAHIKSYVHIGIDDVEFSSPISRAPSSSRLTMISDYPMLIGLDYKTSNGLEGRSNNDWPKEVNTNNALTSSSYFKNEEDNCYSSAASSDFYRSSSSSVQTLSCSSAMTTPSPLCFKYYSGNTNQTYHQADIYKDVSQSTSQMYDEMPYKEEAATLESSLEQSGSTITSLKTLTQSTLVETAGESPEDNTYMFKPIEKFEQQGGFKKDSSENSNHSFKSTTITDMIKAERDTMKGKLETSI